MRARQLTARLALCVTLGVAGSTATPVQAAGAAYPPVRALTASQASPYITPVSLLAATRAGIYRSTDAGETWDAANDGVPERPDGQARPVTTVLVDPLAPTTIAWAGGSFGILRSTDAGASWHRPASGGQPSGMVTVLAADRFGTLYALVDGGGPVSEAGGNLWVSTDRGAHWRRRAGRITAFTVTVDGTLLAISQPARRLRRSDDRGASWQPVGRRLPLVDPRLLNAAPDLPYVLYLGGGTPGGERRLWRSIDTGASWRVPADPLDDAIRSLEIPPGRPNLVLVGTDRGLARSHDKGNSYRPIGGVGLPTSAVVDVLALDRVGIHLLAAVDDAETPVWRSDDAGLTWQPAALGLPTLAP